MISIIRNTDKKGTFELKNHLVLGLRTLLDVLARILIFGCYLYVSHDGNFPAWIATVAYYICFLILLIPNLLIARVSFRSKELYCKLSFHCRQMDWQAIATPAVTIFGMFCMTLWEAFSATTIMTPSMRRIETRRDGATCPLLSSSSSTSSPTLSFSSCQDKISF